MALTIEDLEARQEEIRGRLAQIDQEFAGKSMPDEVRQEWNDLGKELKEDNAKLLVELRARRDFLQDVASDESRREPGVAFHAARPGRVSGDAIWDVAAIRAAARTDEDACRMYRDQAMRAVEVSHFPHPDANREDMQGHVEKLMQRFAGPFDDNGGTTALSEFCRRILTTGSPTYQRAFGKHLVGRPLSPEEQRSLSLTAASGGYAVPYTLDPTIIPTSNGSVNPLRQIARVETISGSNIWKGVSSGAISASRDGEATEVSDDTPTLAQPSITVTKVSAFVPFTYEVGMDWGALQQEMAVLLQDAKDDEEASTTASTSGFVTGDGTGENPQGVITGATSTVAAGTAAFTVAHFYSLMQALPPRYRPRAQFLGNLAIYNLIDQFDTSGGGLFWGDLRDPSGGGGDSRPLKGKPAWEASAMASVLTAGSKILLYGDFRYYCIVDRIGMDIQIVPHLFGASGRPTGQSGIYANWRNSGKVLSASAFRVLQTT